ncbi:nuclear factor NF-kappa-B p105 subunit-like [Daphnia carinata]|uniref:nuclear factor NF-kappa-B p105 subunit-like n=1 Tax=Daphnia carinata TaxID=120202 RepID=UPI00257A4923|nr:nuclear factor NF-kappa-B p105 subunit-like [Daphnia carinata]XP_057374205.1 nuclear factor NF-kappa-B p105 subunit-like [Daphnia carinata]
MQQPTGNSSPYSPESSHSSSSPLSHSYSSGNSPIMSASPNNPYLVTGNLPNSVAVRQARLSPCLSILNQPQSKFRFRYASEMTGTHGCLMAESKERNKKEYIRVQLEGCQEREAIIRCTLVTNSPKPVPHVHRLGGEGNSNGNEGEFQEIVVSASKNDWIATFSGLTIIHTAKKQVREVVERRLITEMGNIPINRNQGQQLKDEADKIANTMDLHSVKLKFEAFVERNGFREQIGPPEYSQAIHNLKSTHAGDLRIVRIDKVYSCCTGQEEIFIFVEKVNKKDIKIRFFETDENEQEIWSAFADFSELDVHHQYAIAFKTPPYQDPNIQSDVTVQFQLFRPSNQSTSEAKSFTYTPRERVGMKRPRRDISVNSDCHTNRREYNPTRTLPQDDLSNPMTSSAFRNNGLSGDKSSNQELTATFRGQESKSFQNLTGNSSTMIENAPLTEPYNPMHLHTALPEQPWPMMQTAPMPYSHANPQQWRPQVPQRITNDDLLRIPIDSGMTPLENENYPWPEINLEHVDDFLLAELLKLDDYGSDACGSRSDTLTPHLKRMTISARKSPSLEALKPTVKVPSTITTSNLMSAYSINMARAVRWYAMTGDLGHILTRMRHLMAMQTDDGDNALHDALIHNQTDAVRTILHAASYHNTEMEFVNAQNNANLAPLHIAVLKNQTEATALLLQSGANPGLADANGNTPVHLAAMDKNLFDCLKLLLNTSIWKLAYVSKLNTRNYAGLTPLHIAINALNIKGVELLLSKGADVNCHETKRGRSALHLAVKKRSEEMVALLLSYASVNVNMQSYDGMTALHLAVIDELDNICALLVNSGADPTILNYVTSSTSSENEENDESEYENVTEDGSETGQSPLDLAQCNLTITKVLREGSKQLLTTGTLGETVGEGEKPVAEDGNANCVILDSGIDLMASKELPKELDKRVISELAGILDSPNKEWEKLADSLDLLLSMQTVLDKQPSPTTYLLSNMDLWEVSTQVILEKLQFLKFTDAAEVLEKYLAT